MLLYDIFAVCAIIGGLYSGTYFLRHAVRYYKMDKFLAALMFVYVLAAYWLAVAYAGTLFRFINVGSLTIGIYTRPATMTLLWMPVLIMQRVGL